MEQLVPVAGAHVKLTRSHQASVEKNWKEKAVVVLVVPRTRVRELTVSSDY